MSDTIKSLDTIKQDICKKCLEFNKEMLISVLNFLHKEHLNLKLFNQCSDGIRINLDILNDDIIYKLYQYVEYKLNEIQLN